MMGDVRVTFTPKNQQVKRLDLLRKVYYVEPALLIGFAGSVVVGLEIVEALTKYATGSTDSPHKLIRRVERTARWAWSVASDDDREQGCELLIVCAYPSHGVIKRSAGWVLKADKFDAVPLAVPQPADSQHLSAIGSGASAKCFDGLIQMTGYEWYTLGLEQPGQPTGPFGHLGAIMKQTIDETRNRA